MKTNPELTFLKLGGSLITNKSQPLTARQGIIQHIADEISFCCSKDPELRLLIGHGSGSFGHVIASQYQTQNGVQKTGDWLGFAEVWAAARELNQIVINTLSAAGLPVMAFPPSAGAITANKILKSWDIQPLKFALTHHLIPIVQGDVIFDTVLGGTIFSTEQVFQHLAQELYPSRILLAGADPGVYRAPGKTEDIIDLITPANFGKILPALSGAKTPDVTGGMLVKVELMLSLVKENPRLKVQIFSGVEPGNIRMVLAGEKIGTLITA